jgi:hypothetical protein
MWKIDYQRTLRCICGDAQGMQRPFIPEPQDWERWKGHKVKVFNVLRDGKWHSRDEIVRRTGVKGFTARISDLRKAGYVVEVNRTNDEGGTTYRILEYVGVDTTGKHTCPTCTCKAL